MRHGGSARTLCKGAVDPDEYVVFKPFLSDASLTPILEKQLGGKAQKMIYATDGDRPTRNVPTSKAERASFVLGDADIVQLARWASIIETHYGCPMDMEWAKDGDTGELFIVQARPETVQSRRGATAVRTYSIKSKGKRLVTGLSIGDAVVAGRVCVIDSPREIDRFVDGAVLVTDDDRSGLGADHEAGRGHRHRSWRPHFACCNRQPRAWASSDRRHWRRDPGVAR